MLNVNIKEFNTLVLKFIFFQLSFVINPNFIRNIFIYLISIFKAALKFKNMIIYVKMYTIKSLKKQDFFPEYAPDKSYFRY